MARGTIDGMSLSSLLSPAHLISAYGLIGVILVIFAETGLFVGFFLPGDSLLFLAGALAATTKPGAPHLSILPLLIGVAVAATLGAQTGYVIGKYLGARLLERPNRRFVKQHHIERTHEVLERYGQFKAVLLARVIPIVRTLINPVVGALGMDARKFTVANILGGVAWSVGVTLLGYWLGSSIDIDKYILPITGVIVVLSLIPVVLELRKLRHDSLPSRHS